MRRLIAAMLILSACGGRPASSPLASAALSEMPATLPVSELRFRDGPLQGIATNLMRRARLQGIDASTGRNRVECLLALEASLGGSDAALTRVNNLVAEMARTDAGPWARMRRQAEQDFDGRQDDASRRVNEMLARWERHRFEMAFRYLSSNYDTMYLSSMQWERRFHDFVAQRPADAATWGWLVLRNCRAATKQQYGRADAETGYRYYLESSGLGDAREAHYLFSVPGVEIRE